MRLYGKIIHERQRVDYRPYRRTNHTVTCLLHLYASAPCTLRDIEYLCMCNKAFYGVLNEQSINFNKVFDDGPGIGGIFGFAWQTPPHYLSHVTIKPVFRVCDQLRLKPACSADETS